MTKSFSAKLLAVIAWVVNKPRSDSEKTESKKIEWRIRSVAHKNDQLPAVAVSWDDVREYLDRDYTENDEGTILDAVFDADLDAVFDADGLPDWFTDFSTTLTKGADEDDIYWYDKHGEDAMEDVWGEDWNEDNDED